MTLTLSPDQLRQLHSLGLNPKNTISKSVLSNTKDIKKYHILAPNTDQIPNLPSSGSNHKQLLKYFKSPLLPILSISGVTLFSFSGLILFKNKIPSPPAPSTSIPVNQPTQVPKSIQHYLLTSQQYFSQAVQIQATSPDSPDIINLLNQSVLTASEAISAFPTDYRAWEQRARIYQSLLGSKPELLSPTINDYSQAFRLNPTSAEISRNLASLYAQQGDASHTLNFLSETVNLEPTKAQNFYDLAKLQQQTGLLPQALSTYQRLLTILTDPAQITQVTAETEFLQKLVSQNPTVNLRATPSSAPTITLPTLIDHPPTLQATNNSGLIIAAPSTGSAILVANQTESNSLSGEATILSGQSRITLTNSHLTATSQIYLTVSQGSSRETLRLISKSKDNFTVGFDSPTLTDITFKWWLIN